MHARKVRTLNEGAVLAAARGWVPAVRAAVH